MPPSNRGPAPSAPPRDQQVGAVLAPGPRGLDPRPRAGETKKEGKKDGGEQQGAGSASGQDAEGSPSRAPALPRGNPAGHGSWPRGVEKGVEQSHSGDGGHAGGLCPAALEQGSCSQPKGTTSKARSRGCQGPAWAQGVTSTRASRPPNGTSRGRDRGRAQLRGGAETPGGQSPCPSKRHRRRKRVLARRRGSRRHRPPPRDGTSKHWPKRHQHQILDKRELAREGRAGGTQPRLARAALPSPHRSAPGGWAPRLASKALTRGGMGQLQGPQFKTSLGRCTQSQWVASCTAQPRGRQNQCHPGHNSHRVNWPLGKGVLPKAKREGWGATRLALAGSSSGFGHLSLNKETLPLCWAVPAQGLPTLPSVPASRDTAPCPSLPPKQSKLLARGSFALLSPKGVGELQQLRQEGRGGQDSGLGLVPPSTAHGGSYSGHPWSQFSGQSGYRQPPPLGALLCAPLLGSWARNGPLGPSPPIPA